MVAALRVTTPPSPGRLRRLGGVSGRLTGGLIGLLLLTVAVSGGAIYQMRGMSADLDRLVRDNFEPLLDAQDLVQRVQILVALTPKLLNAKSSFELDNLQLQIADMFDMLDQGLTQIDMSGRLPFRGATIATQRDALHASIDELITLVRRQMQLRDDMSRARHIVDTLLKPPTPGGAPTGDAPPDAALAAILYQASLATDPSDVNRAQASVRALLGRAASSFATRIETLVDGGASLFGIRQRQIDLDKKLQGEAGNTNLRANQLVYAVTGLGAELRRLTQQARQASTQSVHRATIRACLVVLLAAFVALAHVAYLQVSVLRRLVGLRNGVVSSAAGSPVPVTDDGPDEIGDLARSLRYFIEQIGIKEEELRQLAATDVLTGLANRRDFMARGDSELERAHRYASHLCVMMLDIDHFKKVNDTWGHAVGDDVIREVGGIARDLCRSVDIVGRIGGEEFAVLLPQTAMEGGQVVAERLRAAVAARALSVADGAGKAIKISISIGLAELTQDDHALSHFLGRADAALYEAKQLGRNRVCLAKPSQKPTQALAYEDQAE